jgi:uncharacterized membrane protein (DUF485 family)
MHEPAASSGPDPAFLYKKRLGVRMFFVYLVVYAGFVAINLVSPRMMEASVVAGMNLATVYGFGLIILAIVLSLVYSGLCSKREDELEEKA